MRGFGNIENIKFHQSVMSLCMNSIVCLQTLIFHIAIMKHKQMAGAGAYTLTLPSLSLPFGKCTHLDHIDKNDDCQRWQHQRNGITNNNTKILIE